MPFYRQWHLPDALGSTRQTVVGGGTLTAGRYDPWGAPIDNQIAPFGFAGELQGDGGLVYLRARWYTPQRGVFTARDPFAGWAERPYSQHYFQYGYSNPVLVTDPSGRAGITEAERICPFGTHWDPVIEDCLPNPPVPPPTNPAEPERPQPPRPGIGTLPSVFPSVGVGARYPPQGGADVGDAGIKAGLCTIAALAALDALARALEGVRDAVQSRPPRPILYHYTDEPGIIAIQASGVIRANRRNMVFVSPAQLNPTDAFNILFIGNPLFKGKGDYIVQFTPHDGVVFAPGTQPLELIHFGSLRNGRTIDISYIGPNPFE